MSERRRPSRGRHPALAPASDFRRRRPLPTGIVLLCLSQISDVRPAAAHQIRTGCTAATPFDLRDRFDRYVLGLGASGDARRARCRSSQDGRAGVDLAAGGRRTSTTVGELTRPDPSRATAAGPASRIRRCGRGADPRVAGRQPG
jgi:hypothetical protein